MKIYRGTSPEERKPKRFNIAIRIALLAWFVSLATLVLFVVVTVPQQKRIFIENLESKANGLAVSLHDVAAGAAINEDYASVVSAAQTLLSGDPDLEFLIIMKNNGFSLVVEQKSWRVEEQSSPYWLDRERTSIGVIKTVPLFERRVFHFAQPFDYSGIQWGWIHVGLSLEGYDNSVSALYRKTIMLAIICLGISLAFSILYAKQMVRPIVRLRALVKRIAEGDLSVRADLDRADELGSLAESVNTMADSLMRRDQILESVRFAAQQFLRTPHWQDTIIDVLGHIGLAANASGASVMQRRTTPDGHCSSSKLFEWKKYSTNNSLTTCNSENIVLEDLGLAHWKNNLEKNEIISTSLNQMNDAERDFLGPMNILSIIIIPVFVENTWWGCLLLEDHIHERSWTDAEEDSLRTAADMLGATIARQQAQEELLRAKDTLEQRVLERTQELQDQVTAKEAALSDLASAQNSLLEMSREAGMAEVATGVLHNVGNVLNSVNVSCTLLMDQLRNSRITNVEKVAGLLTDAGDEVGEFLTEDPRGRKVPTYLASLADILKNEHNSMFKEAESLSSRIEHIKEIVAMQQNYGKVSGITETISPEQLMEDALNLNSGALARHNVTVHRKYQRVSPVVVDKHKVLQILLNLINNAKYACSDSETKEKIITLRIYSSRDHMTILEVVDNGMGILPENLTRIFQHGFTTRKSGHGFGLHSGALAAKELGGSLTVHSDGKGCGAIFSLALPTFL